MNVKFTTLHDYDHHQEVEMFIPANHRFNPTNQHIRRIFYIIDSYISNWEIVYERTERGDVKVFTKFRNKTKRLIVNKGEKLIDVLRKDYRRLYK